MVVDTGCRKGAVDSFDSLNFKESNLLFQFEISICLP